MEIPNSLQRLDLSLPPMHTWPRLVKRIVLAVSVLLILVAYGLVTGGIIVSLIMLARQFN